MIYFISDVHLGFKPKNENKELEDMLILFLDKIKADAEKLFIVGDLFDYWFDYKTVIPKDFVRTLAKLLELKHEGIEIAYLIGNHDFGHYTFFSEELDIKIYHNDIQVNLNNKKFYLSHGDGKGYNDTGYKILKKILRSKLNQKIYRLLHPDFGIWLASGSSRKSRHYTDKKNYGETDGQKDFAFKTIDNGFDFVVMGHSHKLELTQHNTGFYVNLGDWIKVPYFARFDGKELILIKVQDFLINNAKI